MTRKQAKEYVLNFEPDFLPAAKRKVKGRLTYICPECGNGTGEDGDGIAYNEKSKSIFPHWKCLKCGLYGDIIESLIQEYNILQKTYKITSEDEMHGLADKFIQRIQERLS